MFLRRVILSDIWVQSAEYANRPSRFQILVLPLIHYVLWANTLDFLSPTNLICKVGIVRDVSKACMGNVSKY